MQWPADTYSDDIDLHILGLSVERQQRMARLVLAGWRFRHIEGRNLVLRKMWRWQVTRPNCPGSALHRTLEIALDCEWFDEANKEIIDGYGCVEATTGEGSVRDERQPGHGSDVPVLSERG